MKTLARSVWWFGWVGAFLCGPGMLCGEESPVWVPLKIWADFGVEGSGDPIYWNVRVEAEFLPSSPTANDGTYLFTDEGYDGGESFFLEFGSVRVEPNKTYSVAFTGYGLAPWTASGGSMNVVAPPGYRVVIEGQFTQTAWFNNETVISFGIVPIQREMNAIRAGTPSSVSSGKLDFNIALGALSDGSSAGRLAMVDAAFWTDWAPLYTPATLSYNPTSTDVVVTESGGSISSITVPEAVASVVVLSTTSYEIRFHVPDQQSKGAGNAFETYRVEKGGTATSLIITRETRDIPDKTATSVTIARSEQTTLTRTGTWPGYSWTFTDWTKTGETPVVQRTETWAGSGGVRTSATITVQVPSGSPDLYLARTFSNTGQVTAETIGSSQGMTTTLDYYADGRLKSKILPGGQWEAYEYFSTGSSVWYNTVKFRYRPYGDTVSSVGFNPGQGEVTEFNYELDPFGSPTRPTLIQTKINSVVTEKTVIGYTSASSANGMAVVQSTRNDYENTSSYLQTIAKFYREDVSDPLFRDQLHSIESPDQVKRSYAYQRGNWNGSTFSLTPNNGLSPAFTPPDTRTVWTRTSSIVGTTAGGASYPTYDGYDIDDLYLVDGKSTLEVVMRDERAQARRTETYVWKNSQWNRVSAVDFAYDYVGRLVSRTASNGALHTITYADGVTQSQQDETGLTLSYQYDVAGRLEKITQAAAGSISALTTKFTFDALGNVVQAKVGDGLSESITSSRDFDDAGRLVSETPPGLGTTTIQYDISNRQRTITQPDGAKVVEKMRPDGRMQSVTDTAVVPVYYSYGVDGNQRRYVRMDVGASSSPRWSKTTSDWLGRGVRSEHPGFLGQSTVVRESFYAAGTGRLQKSTRTGYAPMRYEFDALGQLTRTGLDLNDNGLVTASTDRIIDSDGFLEQVGSDWWLRTESAIYPYTGGSAGTSVSVGFSRMRLTGHPAGRLAEVQTTDPEGNVIVTVTDVDRANALVTVTTARSGFTQSDSVQTFRAGYPVSTTSHDGLTNNATYDALHRMSVSTNSRGNSTTTAYYTGTALPQTITDAASHTIATFAYDTMGRIAWQKNADNQYTFFSYNDRGQVKRQWGAATHPVEFGYAPSQGQVDFGELTSWSMFRGGTGWEQSTWPADPGSADTTHAYYDSATGLLHYRIDAAGMGTFFAYNERGQLNYRSWVRRRVNHGYPDPWTEPEAAVITRYIYDSLTGELTNKNYNDDTDPIPTPDVGYTYNRLGQLSSVTDATGTRDFVYDPAKPWRLASVALDQFFGDRVITQLYATGAVVGRYRGFQLGTISASASDLEQTFAYTTGGRFESIISQRGGTPGTARTFTYGYLTNSRLVESLTPSDSSFVTTRGYEATRDLLSFIDSKWSGSSVARYDYTHNALRQRVTAKQSGSAFADYGEPTFRKFSYNTRGELTQAVDYLGSSVTDLSRPLPGRLHEYAYDNGGNRTSANRTGVSDLREDYSTNALNQYTGKENTTVPLSGSTVAGASVAIGGQTAAAGQQGRFWSNDVVVDNASAPWSGNLTIHAAYNGAVRSETRAARIPAFGQSFSYDLDGNLSSDGIWDYTWDAENRLVRMQTTGAAAGAGYPNRRLDFQYDYLGRRVQKLVFAWSGSSWSLSAGRRFLYDGWNLIAEYDTTGSTLGALARSYTWGLDVVGSIAASGGVGALVQIADHASGKTYLPTYDGNGNLTALVNASNGSLAAAYEYNAFGESLRAEVFDATVTDQPFRFSTKFTDLETGLIYYGHRYFSPALGRFINRDPIGEAGGLNLYGFCGNDAVNGLDVLGLDGVWGFHFGPNGQWFIGFVRGQGVYLGRYRGDSAHDYRRQEPASESVKEGLLNWITEVTANSTFTSTLRDETPDDLDDPTKPENYESTVRSSGFSVEDVSAERSGDSLSKRLAGDSAAKSDAEITLMRMEAILQEIQAAQEDYRRKVHDAVAANFWIYDDKNWADFWATVAENAPVVSTGANIVIFIRGSDLRGNIVSRGDVILEIGEGVAMDVVAGGAVRVAGVVVGVVIQGGKKIIKIGKKTLTIRNGHLAGKVHPKTGVRFDADGYPDFSPHATHTVTIQQTGDRAADFAAANRAAGLSETPAGYTWHHHQDGKTMQLVPRVIHQQTGHTGGVATGGG